MTVAAAIVCVPAAAFHFPWDQGHDTTNPQDPQPPGPDDRPENDPCNSSGSSRSPVYASAGHCFWSDTDVQLRGRPLLAVQRTYNSNDPAVGIFGNGWTVDFDVSLAPANAAGQVQRIFKAPNGKRFVFVRQPDGRWRAPASRRETIEEGPDRVTMTTPDGRAMVFGLDGRLLERVDANGLRIAVSHDAQARPVRLADAAGRSLELTYNAGGFVDAVTDHGGRTWRYQYDAAGNLTAVIDPLGGRLAYRWQMWRPPGDAQPYAQLLSVTDPAGVVKVAFTWAGAQVASWTEGANRHSYARSSSNTRTGGTVTRTDLAGARTSFVYGAQGLVTQDTNALGAVTRTAYDANGRPVQLTDALGGVWSWEYDARGRQVRRTNPLGESVRLAYAGDSPWPQQVTSATGRLSTFAYDARGSLLSITDAAGAVTRLAYNTRGDLTRIANPLGQAVTVAHNSAGLPVRVTDPIGRQEQFTYDSLGRIVSFTDAAGAVTRWAHDALDRVVSVTDARGGVIGFAYDAAGRVLSVTDPAGAVYRFEYDTHGRRIAETTPDGRRTQFAWRVDNLLESVRWPDGVQVQYAYDAGKRLVMKTAGTDRTTYVYDALDRLVSATSPGGSIALRWDAAGRQVGETSAGQAVDLQLNAEGERTRMQALGQVVDYVRDARGALTRLDTAIGSFDFTLDVLGRRVSQRWPTGATATHAYDAAGQMTALTHGGAFVADYRLSFDTAGRITAITGDGPGWNYQYDATGRLVRAEHGGSVAAYQWDAVGNRIDGARTYDAAHRITGDAERIYTHDARGNLVLEQDRASGARVAYAWSADNRLRQVDVFPNATAVTPTRRLVYTHDPLGRRSSASDNGVLTRFVYDGDDLIARLGPGDTVIDRFVYSGRVDEPLAWADGAAARMLHGNHQGSIVGVSQGSALAASYRYGPWGETLAPSAPDGVPMRWAGREKDTATLYHLRARAYDTRLQRFLSPDPGGLANGIHPYAHAYGDPVLHTDPTGEIGLVGAGLGALVNFGFQMTTNYLANGGDLGKAFRCVDWVGVGTAAAVGAFFPGAGSVVGKGVGAALGRDGAREALKTTSREFGKGLAIRTGLNLALPSARIGDACECQQSGLLGAAQRIVY